MDFSSLGHVAADALLITQFVHRKLVRSSSHPTSQSISLVTPSTDFLLNQTPPIFSGLFSIMYPTSQPSRYAHPDRSLTDEVSFFCVETRYPFPSHKSQ